MIDSLTSAKNAAIELLRGLVSIPSLSTQEAEASHWLVQRMAELGYDRAFVDEAGNAVGELGHEDCPTVVTLLGHIDTVPGKIPVRIDTIEGEDVLFGRGSVDAKGPLATFVMAGAALGGEWAHQVGVRLVVVGAVEEEAATSKGARFVRDRFDGVHEPLPVACVIGEPSGWHRITLGYKGRLLVEMRAGQPMAHTAGPAAGVATQAVGFWNWLDAYADAFNVGRERLFEQLQPSLRTVHTNVDDEMNDTVDAVIGIRIPLEFDADALIRDALEWCTAQFPETEVLPRPLVAGSEQVHYFKNENGWVDLSFRGYEPAWHSSRQTPVVRAFLNAIRGQGARPGFVVKTGTSDMNVVGPAWRCPIVAYGPGDSSLDHTPHEHVSLSEYERAIAILAEALRSLSPSVVRGGQTAP